MTISGTDMVDDVNKSDYEWYKPEGEDDSYAAGYDCGFNGPNTMNCHFSFFATRQATNSWERGKRDGESKACNHDKQTL